MKKQFSLSNVDVFMAYEAYASQAESYAESTIAQARGAIRNFFEILEQKDMRKVNRADLLKYKETIRQYGKDGTLNLVSALKEIEKISSFLEWFCEEKGKKSLSKNDIKFLSLTKEERGLFAASPLLEFPSQEEIEKISEIAPRRNEVEWRNRIAFILLNSIPLRNKGLTTLKIGCFDLENGVLYQGPKYGTNPKHSQTFASYIFDRIPGAKEEIKEWIDYLRRKGFTDQSPIFPKAKVKRSADNKHFVHSTEVEDAEVSAKSTLNSILHVLTDLAGVKFYTSHRYRHSLAAYALERCHNYEEVKMLMKCFGHKTINTIMQSYGQHDLKRFAKTGERLDARMKDKNYKGIFI